MHQVKRSFTPDFRIRTGCRWRNTFESMTSTRLRSLVGRPCLKIEVQTCVSVSQFQNRTKPPSFGTTLSAIAFMPTLPVSGFQKRLRIGPLAQLALEVPRLVHQNLAVVGQHHASALERPRGWPFEIH